METKILKEKDDSSYFGELGVTKEIECYCGNSDFRVMQGAYLTVIECRECHRKYVIHEG